MMWTMDESPRAIQRREFLRLVGLAAGATALGQAAWLRANPTAPARAKDILARLAGEPVLRSEVRTERGGPRLFVNGSEVYPLMATATSLVSATGNFAKAGIHLYNPIVGTGAGWLEPGVYDWTLIDIFFAGILEADPEARLLPRLQIDAPNWWKAAHPEDCMKYAFEGPADRYDVVKTQHLPKSEGGYHFGEGEDLWAVSFASEKWRADTADVVRSFIAHFEASPLRSRIVGYHPVTGQTGEWNCWGAEQLPDLSAPMLARTGPAPAATDRLTTTAGLLRDPAREQAVIDYYAKLHEVVAETVMCFARVVKDALNRRLICGTFYGYLLEQVEIQEGGYLEFRKVLACPDLDYLAVTCSYQGKNGFDAFGSPTMLDGAGNAYGHSRGVGGTGAYRAMTESIRRSGKLYLSEMDPSTCVDKHPLKVVGGDGGPGSDTVIGTLRILDRDLGQMFTRGAAGWLFDFGSVNSSPQGWYSTPPIIEEIRRFAELGRLRTRLDISPVSDVAVVADDKVFTATQHWLAEKPWKKFGMGYSDFINHWFLNTQSQGIFRLGAPADFLHHEDLTRADCARYRLLLALNIYRLSRDQVKAWRDRLKGSGAVVLWVYAPGYIAPDRLDLEQMETLTGMRFSVLPKPGRMMIATEGAAPRLRFGVAADRGPRFVVRSPGAEILGRWVDNHEPAFARVKDDGYTSVYVGTGPVPIAVLRWLAAEAKVPLWSSRSDIVYATRDIAMLVAAEPGRRVLSLPHPLMPVDGGAPTREHTLDLEIGEVRLFRKALEG
jgi:hypothetical protein